MKAEAAGAVIMEMELVAKSVYNTGRTAESIYTKDFVQTKPENIWAFTGERVIKLGGQKMAADVHSYLCAMKKPFFAKFRYKFANAVVYSIEHDTKGVITAVRYKKPDGTSGRITGKIFVFAANAIEMPKLTLISKSSKYPNGVGNSHDQVGRHLMDHSGTSVSFLSKDPYVARKRAYAGQLYS